MYKINNSQSLVMFNDLIKKTNYKYPTNFSDNNFILKKYSRNSTKYLISVQGPKIWNRFLKKEDKKLKSFPLYWQKNQIKTTWNQKWDCILLK